MYLSNTFEKICAHLFYNLHFLQNTSLHIENIDA